MVTVRHPRIESLSRQVPTKDVQRWLASGWVPDKPSARRPAQSNHRRSKPKPRTKQAPEATITPDEATDSAPAT